jgi:hypothetical protein
MPTRLVLQAYGSDDVREEALYAAWSALAWQGDAALAVHVYTDAPAAFAPLAASLALRPLSPEDIRRWRGPCDFTHRLKAEMIREVARLHPSDPLLYLDADVFFVSPVAPVLGRIGPGAAVMHEREYNVAERDTPQLRKFRRRMTPLRFRGEPVDLTRDMWNAGALGLHPAQFDVLDAWLEFIDALYPSVPAGLVEQYGASLLVQRRARVSPCADAVFHYWFQKEEYGAAIRGELAVLRERPLADALAHLRAHRLALPPPARRRHRTTLSQRVGRVVKRWFG